MKRKLGAAVVDVSALICIAKGEPAANVSQNAMTILGYERKESGRAKQAKRNFGAVIISPR